MALIYLIATVSIVLSGRSRSGIGGTDWTAQRECTSIESCLCFVGYGSGSRNEVVCSIFSSHSTSRLTVTCVSQLSSTALASLTEQGRKPPMSTCHIVPSLSWTWLSWRARRHKTERCRNDWRVPKQEASSRTCPSREGSFPMACCGRHEIFKNLFRGACDTNRMRFRVENPSVLDPCPTVLNMI